MDSPPQVSCATTANLIHALPFHFPVIYSFPSQYGYIFTYASKLFGPHRTVTTFSMKSCRFVVNIPLPIFYQWRSTMQCCQPSTCCGNRKVVKQVVKMATQLLETTNRAFERAPGYVIPLLRTEYHLVDGPNGDDLTCPAVQPQTSSGSALDVAACNQRSLGKLLE